MTAPSIPPAPHPNAGTVALQMKVKTVAALMLSLEGVKVEGQTEGDLLRRMIQRVLDLGESAEEEDVRQKYFATAMDAIIKLQALQAKMTTDLMDLRIRKEDLRAKRAFIRAKLGFGADKRKDAKPDVASLADQLRGSE